MIDQCVERAIEHAVGLRAKVSEGKLRSSVVEGLMISYLGQPRFEPEQRGYLLQRALQHIGYRLWSAE